MKFGKASLLMALLGVVVFIAGEVAGDEGNSSTPNPDMTLEGIPMADVVNRTIFQEVCLRNNSDYCNKEGLSESACAARLLKLIYFPDGKIVDDRSDSYSEWLLKIDLSVVAICGKGRRFIESTTPAGGTQGGDEELAVSTTEAPEVSTTLPLPSTTTVATPDSDEVTTTTEGTTTTPAPGPEEFDHLYWILPVAIILLLVLIAGLVYLVIRRYAKRAGYQSSAKNATNGEGATATKIEGKDVV